MRTVVKPSRRPPRRGPRHLMPADVRRELFRRGLMLRYRSRPHYQQNDYLGWISRAQSWKKRERGDRYMYMVYRPRGR